MSVITANKPKKGKVRGRMPNGLKGYITDFFNANRDKNAAAKAEREAKVEIEKAMAQHDLKEVALPVNGHNVEAVYDVVDVETLDIAKLAELVDKETFIDCVKATKTAVEKVAGRDIMLKCTKTTKSAQPKLSIKVKKA